MGSVFAFTVPFYNPSQCCLRAVLPMCGMIYAIYVYIINRETHSVAYTMCLDLYT